MEKAKEEIMIVIGMQVLYRKEIINANEFSKNQKHGCGFERIKLQVEHFMLWWAMMCCA